MDRGSFNCVFSVGDLISLFLRFLNVLGHYLDLIISLLQDSQSAPSNIPPFSLGCVFYVEMQEGDHMASASEDRETNCWGCGLRVCVSAYASVFKCGWCGAITKENVVKNDNIRFRRWLDRCFVTIVILFMLFFICKHGHILTNVKTSYLSHPNLLSAISV